MATHMVTVKVGTNLNRTTVMVESNTTLRRILEDAELNYSTSTIFLDGATLNPGDMDKTLDDLHIQETCYLIAAQKTENA